jgi:membrane-bound ClpP family serine protease
MLEFLLTNLPVLVCVVAGLGLLILEVFLPGFGVPGVSGIVLLLVSVGLVWVEMGPLAAMGLVVVIMALIAISLSIALKSASSGRFSKSPIILRDAERAENGYSASNDMSVFVGRSGTTRTILRPSGIADFDGVRLNVVSDGTYIRQGARVCIERVEGSRIVVREAA